MPVNTKWYLDALKEHREKNAKRRNIIAFQTAIICVMLVCIAVLLTNLNTYKKLYADAISQNEILKEELDNTTERYHIELNTATAALDQLEKCTETISTITAELEAAEEYIATNMVTPDEKKYTRNTDLGVTTIMTADRMDRIIDYWLDQNNGHSTSPFSGQGQAFITASQESGLDPVFIFALASHESNFGRSKLATNKQNYMGIGAYDKSPYLSALTMGSTFEEGITANAKWIADKYYNQGQTTLSEMIYGKKTYSTSKDSWINGVNSIMSASSKIN